MPLRHTLLKQELVLYPLFFVPSLFKDLRRAAENQNFQLFFLLQLFQEFISTKLKASLLNTPEETCYSFLPSLFPTSCKLSLLYLSSLNADGAGGTPRPLSIFVTSIKVTADQKLPNTIASIP